MPIKINGDDLTDLLSYNATTGQAVFSVTTNARVGIQISSKWFMHRKGGRRCADEHQR